MASLMRKLRMNQETITEEQARDLLKNQLEALQYDKSLRQLGISNAEEYLHKYVERVNDEARVNAILNDPNVPSDKKMHLKCENNIKWGKLLYYCEGCWLLPGNCVCRQMKKVSFDNVKVVLHMHHAEWGRGSNSGTVLHQSIEGTEMLMHYHEPHDRRMKEILEDKESLPVVLWPGDGALLPSEVKEMAAARTNGRLTVIALDATWSNARRLCYSYPKDTIFVKLPPENALGDLSRSILAPVRSYNGDVGETGRVSTLEATAALLLELTGDRKAYDTLLDNLRYKVDVLRTQNSRQPVYGKVKEEGKGFVARCTKTVVQYGKKARHRVMRLVRGRERRGAVLVGAAVVATAAIVAAAPSLVRSLRATKGSA